MKAYSFIFPIHNEADFLSRQINEFIGFVKPKYKNSFEIILVENGSTDHTWKIIKKIQKKFSFIKVYHLPYPSYGSAIRLGILNAIGKKIFILNVDYFNFDFIQKADVLLNTVDLVIGSKTLVASNDQRPIYRRIGTYFFNVFLRLVLNYPGTDTHGIKAFKKSSRLIDLSKVCRTQNELFDTELVLKLTRSGAIFVDLPSQVSELRVSRYFGLRRIKSTLYDFFAIVKSKYFLKTNFLSPLVDADDFGFSKRVNQAIINEVRNQAIDIVSIMPNIVQKKDIVFLKKASKKLIFAMHFNVLRGKPVSRLKYVGSLIDKNGFFYSLPMFSLRLVLGLISFKEVEIEFFAQYKRLRNLGIQPLSLNSEQHIHILSPINRLVERLIKQTSITKIRSEASSFFSLENKILRKIGLIILKNVCQLRFGGFKEFKKKYHAHIVHPGALKTIF